MLSSTVHDNGPSDLLQRAAATIQQCLQHVMSDKEFCIEVRQPIIIMITIKTLSSSIIFITANACVSKQVHYLCN